MKKRDIENMKNTALELEARARQLRLDMHETACRDAIEHVALAEKKLGRADEITIAVGTRNEAAAVVTLLRKIRERLENILRMNESYVPEEDE